MQPIRAAVILMEFLMVCPFRINTIRDYGSGSLRMLMPTAILFLSSRNLSSRNVTRLSRRSGRQRATSHGAIAGSGPALSIRCPILGAFAGLGKDIG